MLKTIRGLAFISFLFCIVGFRKVVVAGNRLQTSSNGFVILEWHPNGQFLAVVLDTDLNITAHSDQELWLYSATGEPIIQYPLDVEQSFLEIAWSPSGTKLAVNTFHSTSGVVKIFIWDTLDLDSPRLISSFPESHPSAKDMSWKDDNSLAINRNDEIQIWNVIDGNITDFIDGNVTPANLSHIAWSKDGKYLAGGKSDTVFIWDMTVLPHILVVSLPVTPTSFYDLIWSPDSNRIAVSDGADIDIWEWNSTSSSFSQLTTLTGHADYITRLDWKDSRIASSSFDNTVRVWDAVDWEELEIFPSSPIGGTKAALSLSPDGTQLAYSGPNGELVIENQLGYQPLLERIYDTLAKASN